ncbi:DUF2914 domain-containing protein [bacterium]|nr:DUF2914 domain-containing protein [bacterium]
MNRTLAKFRNSAIRRFVRKHERYVPITFFIGGFIFDTLTLGRIDRLYDLIVLSLHMTSLTVMLYLFNLAEDGKWKNTFLEGYEEYFPLAIQFFFGGLSSAFVIYFSRSVSLSKTVSFFIILIGLFLANELLKKRISNKYLQFGVYFFINFTFFTFMLPVFLKKMNASIFLYSGLLSLVCTLALILIIYAKSRATRNEIKLHSLLGIVVAIYITINLFYYFKMIPPVPLALDTGIVAHNVTKRANVYNITYEAEDWYVFWRKHKQQFHYVQDENVFIFSSIFAPTDLKQSILHRWFWYNSTKKEWQLIDDIGYDITGGRNDGFRGYTFKKNVIEGLWKVEVITNDELVLGVIDFEIVNKKRTSDIKMVKKQF